MIITNLQKLVPQRQVRQQEALFIAEKQAQRLRAHLAVDGPDITNDHLQAIPGLCIEEIPGLKVSGATCKVEGIWVILTNADEPAVRRRFTIGHEIKHILDDANASHTPTDQSSWLTERICDYFAACLLMPRMWVKRAWTTTTQDEAELAKMFNVSIDAIRIRLRQTGLVEAQRCSGSSRGVIPLSTRTAA